MVLIPAYNEASRIAQVVLSIKKICPYLDVVVISDGSSDDTAKIARNIGAVVLSHPFNMGYGVAIQTGYKYALANNYDYLVQLDADGQHDPSCIPALLAPVQSGEADIAIGSRFLGNSYHPPFLRRLGMSLFRLIVSRVTGRQVTDTTSGFQAFNRDVIAFFATDIFPVDYPDADMLIMLHRAGFRMTEVPVRMFENSDGTSMHSGLKPLYYMFKMLLSIGVTLMRNKGKRL
ncbi:glycosyltransferase family 2 protein [Geobacter chapellei]|uniref:Glycosyltransferase family 2 protein n=2 Tax=Pelotalea chapellei TaxID=44671 RepID=A0ABS5UA68_9BACT|nr:glycosyltransferase family 2 protein [Pelotalea chapellei]